MAIYCPSKNYTQNSIFYLQKAPKKGPFRISTYASYAGPCGWNSIYPKDFIGGKISKKISADPSTLWVIWANSDQAFI